MFISQIRERRSIRKYTEKRVEPEKVEQIIEALLRSPSSRGLNPWEFIVITDKVLLEGLSKLKPHGSSFLENAVLGIVVCADPSIAETWVEDTAIAAIMGQLTAESLGLGSCWIQVRARNYSSQQTAEAYIAELLDIPANLNIESIIAIGYGDEIKPSKKSSDLQYEKVKLNSYRHPYKQ
ncbi:MAG: NAD(P)H-dependent dehydrogenase/reductase [Deltaproteobacteria bacterium]|nr:NAD(P)H-dependent dehydrogenase/reductase [Deltaproteobacteria bacterium]MBT4264179.1 NAD(P)H-dependent dehydrogenase/reductase [Deltaproteobacteria bacterium]MBT4642812.1 NAD(P)H-dependent dehydrogenase/reductase [Deltaproteobacteria bacterium]MBT6499313.1 NAD(P)H-dependent dehydrogenase/reductase [Deltaproteobacteria bacterium]MBT6613435.1 NAD(P)H-dependent dehydrogenase/reductase [Deltaproteobacteria bacterium]